MSTLAAINFSEQLLSATDIVFGQSTISAAVERACLKFRADVDNIVSSRGINSLLIAVVGAKGQGKTWVARQLISNTTVKNQLKSGDLSADATTRLFWIGPTAPENIDAAEEVFLPCSTDEMVAIGVPYVLLDTPGVTDTNQRAATLATEALSLAQLKLLVVARDQLRAAANLQIAAQIDGSECVLVITSVDPEEMKDGDDSRRLQQDIDSLIERLKILAKHSHIVAPILVSDFELTGSEDLSRQQLIGGLLDHISNVDLPQMMQSSGREVRVQSAVQRLRREVSNVISDELPQLASAVEQLNQEADQLPTRVLSSLLGSENVLETGVRMRLRARIVSDTSLIWFPYRTVIGILNLTQGAWDRVLLAMTGSVPSLFGALTTWARNFRSSQDFTSQVQDGVKQRTQQQVEERLRPLFDQFHRTVLKLQPRESRPAFDSAAVNIGAMRLTGVDELQSLSQKIFDSAIEQNVVRSWLIQGFGLLGTVLFWGMMAGPILVVYRDYVAASISVLTGSETHLEQFPQPTSGLFFTSLLLSILPLLIFAMLVLTLTLRRNRIKRVVRRIVSEHEAAISDLRQSNVIHLQIEDDVLKQARFLLSLQRKNG